MTGSYWSELSDESIDEIVDASLSGGINWFDTAEAYGGGESERSLAWALRRLEIDPQTVIIATKWWPFLHTARAISRNIDQRLEALNVPHVDLYQIHIPYSLSSTRSEMRAMAKLLDRGVVRYVGLSNYSARSMHIAHQELAKTGHTLVSNQVKFNLLDRSIETNGVLETARELGMSLIAYSPLAQGLLTGKFHAEPGRAREAQPFRKIYNPVTSRRLDKSRPLIQKLHDLASKYRATPSQVALSWVLQVHGDLLVTVAGASKAYQARDNAKAMNITLSDDDMGCLNSASRDYAGLVD